MKIELKNLKIGFGCWKIPHENTCEACLNALSVNYKLIDTALVYGNEKGVGEALKISQIKRDNVIIQSKLWNSYQGKTKTLIGFNKSLENLNLDYIDIFLIHWPIPKNKKHIYKKNMIETWQVLEEIKNKGLIKEIGVSNFKVSHLEILKNNCSITPYLNQIEAHIGYIDFELLDYCKKHSIIVEAWSPFKSGDMKTLENQFDDLLVKYNTNIYGLTIAYLNALDIIPIIRSTDIEHLKFNLNATKIVLSEEDIIRLNNYKDDYVGHDSDNISF